MMKYEMDSQCNAPSVHSVRTETELDALHWGDLVGDTGGGRTIPDAIASQLANWRERWHMLTCYTVADVARVHPDCPTCRRAIARSRAEYQGLAHEADPQVVAAARGLLAELPA